MTHASRSRLATLALGLLAFVQLAFVPVPQVQAQGILYEITKIDPISGPADGKNSVKLSIRYAADAAASVPRDIFVDVSGATTFSVKRGPFAPTATGTDTFTIVNLKDGSHSIGVRVYSGVKSLVVLSESFSVKHQTLPFSVVQTPDVTKGTVKLTIIGPKAPDATMANTKLIAKVNYEVKGTRMSGERATLPPVSFSLNTTGETKVPIELKRIYSQVEGDINGTYAVDVLVTSTEAGTYFTKTYDVEIHGPVGKCTTNPALLPSPVTGEEFKIQYTVSASGTASAQLDGKVVEEKKDVPAGATATFTIPLKGLSAGKHTLKLGLTLQKKVLCTSELPFYVPISPGDAVKAAGISLSGVTAKDGKVEAKVAVAKPAALQGARLELRASSVEVEGEEDALVFATPLPMDAKQQSYTLAMDVGKKAATHDVTVRAVDASENEVFSAKKSVKVDAEGNESAPPAAAAKAGISLLTVTAKGGEIQVFVQVADPTAFKDAKVSIAARAKKSGGGSGTTVDSGVEEMGGTKKLHALLLDVGKEEATYEVEVLAEDESGRAWFSASKIVTVDAEGDESEREAKDGKEPAGSNTDKDAACPGGTKRSSSGLCEPIGVSGVPVFENLGGLFSALLKFVGTMALYIAVIFMVVAGYYYIIARGNDKDYGEAKQSMLGIAIGLGIVGIASSAVEAVGGSLLGGGDAFQKAAMNFWEGVLKPIVNFLTIFGLGWAVLMFVIAGVRMIGSGGKPEEITQARHTFMYGFGGLIAIGISEAAVAVFSYNGLENGVIDLLDAGMAEKLGNDITTKIFEPLMAFFVSFIGVAAIALIIKAGYDFMTAQGESGKIGTAKTEIQYALVGLLVIGLAESVVKTVFKVKERALVIQTADAIQTIVTFVNWALSFVGSIALLMYVYAGFLFLTDAGDGGRKKKGQDILTYTTIGILVILFSYALVNIFMTGGNAY